MLWEKGEITRHTTTTTRRQTHDDTSLRPARTQDLRKHLRYDSNPVYAAAYCSGQESESRAEDDAFPLSNLATLSRPITIITYRVCSVSVLREPYFVSRWRRSSLRVRLRDQEPPLPCPHAPHRLPRKGSRKFAPRSAIATSLGEVFLERRDSEFQWNCAFYFAYSICSSLKIVPA